MAAKHALVTALFWVVWLACVWQGSHVLADRWPASGDLLGVLGTLMLFFPAASTMAWDVVSRLSRQPRDQQGQPLASSLGYVAFSWRRLWVNALGITLVGLGFGINYLSKLS